MKYDTAGQLIYEPIYNCNCGSTGGCKNCRPQSHLDNFIGIITDEEAKEMKKRVTDFRKKFNKDLAERHAKMFPKDTPLDEEVLKITDKIPQKQWDEATGKIRVYCKN